MKWFEFSELMPRLDRSDYQKAMEVVGDVGVGHIDVEREQAEILQRNEDRMRRGMEIVRAANGPGPITMSESKVHRILEEAGVLDDAWRRDFTMFVVLEMIRAARQHRN
jgi:hypothetical protein